MAGHPGSGRGMPKSPLRILGSYAVVYLLAGAGHYADANGVEAMLGPGDLLLIFPDLAHTYGPSENQAWSELYLVFDGPVFDLWRTTGVLDSSQPVRHLEPIDYWARAFEKVAVDLHLPGVGPALSNVCTVLSILAEALTTPEKINDPDDRQWLASATALLDADTRREKSLESIASQLAISYDGFRKRFRRLAGVSPARYRSQRSIDRACELIAQGDLTNRQIAAALGYCDEFHFSHRFRQITGKTPHQFRSALPVEPATRS